jgi:hypothetical protein
MGCIGGSEWMVLWGGLRSAALQVIETAVPGTAVTVGFGVALHVRGGSGVSLTKLDAVPRDAEFEGFKFVIRVLDKKILASAQRALHSVFLP